MVNKPRKDIRGILSDIKSPLVFFAFSLFIVESFFTISLALDDSPAADTHQLVALILSFIMFLFVVSFVFFLTWKTPSHLVYDKNNHIQEEQMRQGLHSKDSYKHQFEKYSTEDIVRMEQSDDDPSIKKAYDELRDGNLRAAINKFKELIKNDKKYNTHLISALAVSPTPGDWKAAEKLLKKYGKPEHYRKLAFNYWCVERCDKAISLSEKAMDILEDTDPKDDELIGSIKNSLAYYYADANRTDSSDVAYQYAREEVDRRSGQTEGTDPLNNYSDALDTLGFVKISFGCTTEEIQSGIEDCMEALSTGGNKDLFQKHYDKAMVRMQHVEN